MSDDKPPQITLSATVPQELVEKFIQHIRDFDVANPECHFNILAVTSIPVEEMLRMLQNITPPFDTTNAFKKH